MSDFFNEMEEKVVKKRRDEAIDLLKFIAIYMVILGHCLGRLGLGMDVLDHPIGRLITMVNMPLFIFITGYFGQSFYKRSLLQLISVKYKTLLRPTIVYALIIVIICNYIIMSTPFSIIGGGKIWIENIVYEYWFIIIVLYSSFYSWLFVKSGDVLHVNRIIALLVSWVILLAVPETKFIPHISSFKALYTFFLLGMLSCKFGLLEKLYAHRKYALFFSALIYFIGALFFKGTWSFYYFSQTRLPQLAYYYVFLLITGLTGIIFLYLISRLIWVRYNRTKLISTLASLGQFSLAIYLMQGILVEIADCYKEQLTIGNHYVLTAVAIVASIVITGVICWIVNKIVKSKFLSAYLLGK